MNRTAGRFGDVGVRTGLGGGLASGLPLGADGTTTHFHAARIALVGDTVLAVSRTFDLEGATPLRLTLRAFAASAPGRGAIVTLDERELLRTPGAIAFAALELARPGDDAQERRPAVLERCIVTDAAATPRAARSVADWLRSVWEVELAFGSWPAVTGTLGAFAADGGAVADWATSWLEEGDHQVLEADTPEAGTFLKVLSAAWLDPAR